MYLGGETYATVHLSAVLVLHFFEPADQSYNVSRS